VDPTKACEHAHVTKEFAATGGSARTSRRKRNRVRYPKFSIGERVRFADGTFTGTGVVDAFMADYSIIWLWTDGGTGRKMFLQGSGTIVEPLEAPAEDGGWAPVRPTPSPFRKPVVREREEAPALSVEAGLSGPGAQI
jgi:hypothetical protein